MRHYSIRPITRVRVLPSAPTSLSPSCLVPQTNHPTPRCRLLTRLAPKFRSPPRYPSLGTRSNRDVSSATSRLHGPVLDALFLESDGRDINGLFCLRGGFQRCVRRRVSRLRVVIRSDLRRFLCWVSGLPVINHTHRSLPCNQRDYASRDFRPPVGSGRGVNCANWHGGLVDSTGEIASLRWGSLLTISSSRCQQAHPIPANVQPTGWRHLRRRASPPPPRSPSPILALFFPQRAKPSRARLPSGRFLLHGLVFRSDPGPCHKHHVWEIPPTIY